MHSLAQTHHLLRNRALWAVSVPKLSTLEHLHSLVLPREQSFTWWQSHTNTAFRQEKTPHFPSSFPQPSQNEQIHFKRKTKTLMSCHPFCKPSSKGNTYKNKIHSIKSVLSEHNTKNYSDLAFYSHRRYLLLSCALAVYKQVNALN